MSWNPDQEKVAQEICALLGVEDTPKFFELSDLLGDRVYTEDDLCVHVQSREEDVRRAIEEYVSPLLKKLRDKLAWDNPIVSELQEIVDEIDFCWECEV